MDTLAKLLGRFVSRDIIYIAGGLLIIGAIDTVGFSKWLALQGINKWLPSDPHDLIRYVTMSALAYLASYFAVEIFSICRITINHEWWYPRPNLLGRLISWTHEQIHGVSLLVARPLPTGLHEQLVQPNKKAHEIIESLIQLGEKGSLRSVLYPYYIMHFDADEEDSYWISRLTWLRFFGAISGSCLLASGVILILGGIINFKTGAADFGLLKLGAAAIGLGMFLALHAYYRSAQITLARFLVLSRPRSMQKTHK